MMNKAWEVTIPDISGGLNILAGPTASKVRYDQLVAVCDAGWTGIFFPDIRVVRAPAYDALAAETEGVRLIGSQHDDGSRYGCLANADAARGEGDDAGG